MKRILVAASVVILAAAGWRFAKACAPDFFRAVFSFVRHPDLPRTQFIDGRLGVLQPTFARSYLVIAYRYLNGIGMNPREREQARDYYKDRGSGERIGSDWPARWQVLRSRIKSPVGPQPSLITGGQLAYNPETHSFALNCAEDAFRVAVHTLEARRARFGVTSPAFRSWVGAQDQVFRNCDGHKPEIPAESSAALPPLIRADRDYQIAAAHFYAGNYPAALDRFRRIGQDSSSPWNAISHYLVVRTLLRMTDGTKSAESVRLRADAQAILSDPKLGSVHGMTLNLVERAGIRERDQVYFRDLARLLSSQGQDDGLREELWNYTDIYDEVIGEADPNLIDRFSKPAPADVARFRDADLTDWIFSFQSRDASVFSHCLRRWQQTRSLPWLLAAWTHTNAAGAESTGLLEAARSIAVDSPAYLTARFHLLRIYAGLGDKARAREGLDALLSSAALQGLPSSINLFRGLRMLVSPSLADFLGFAPRRPVMVTLQMNLGEVPGFLFEEQITNRPKTADLFDADATRVLNRETPFRLLREVALSGSLPPALQREALLIAFSRGLMLSQDISEIATRLGNTEPQLASLANAYLSETDDDGRRFVGAFLLLRRPEARPYFATGITRQSSPGRLDPYRDNWWCPVDIGVELGSRATYEWYWETPNRLQKSASKIPEFLAGSTAAEAKREMDILGPLGAAADFLGGIVLPYAKSHPEDPRVPEALYWLIRAGHYGCADVNTWKTTRAAFRELQQHYPHSRWAKRTPTWVKNDYDIRREIKDRKLSN